MDLTERELQIVALLRRDPMIGSAEIARRLATSRAAVNVHLSNLGKKGVILGRGYILNEQPGVVVIGGANLDVKARSAARMTAGTSNPGHGSIVAGGVARNIAENLARLGTRTFLVAAIGRDAAGENLLAQSVA
ncbi:MAG: PfkB family carbohydrate kinase, partial [Solirubrobacteraceae bacterium]